MPTSARNGCKDLVPSVKQINVMFNPRTSLYNALFMKSIEAAAPSFGMFAISHRMSAFGPLAGVNRTFLTQSETDAADPGCVKTHTVAKCRKNNSPGRHHASRVQYDLILRMQFLREVSTRAARVGVFTQPRPICDISAQFLL